MPFALVSELRRRVVDLVMAALVGLTVLMAVGPAWALSVMPGSPTADQPFTISLPSPTTGVVYVLDSSGCAGGSVVYSAFIGPPSYSVTVPGQNAGEYSAFVGTVSTCIDFTIVPA